MTHQNKSIEEHQNKLRLVDKVAISVLFICYLINVYFSLIFTYNDFSDYLYRYVSTASALSNGHITPVQQMVSSGAGALLVSLFMTPLDVVKIRLQAQDSLHQRKCFLYSNGLMDHYCPR